MSASKIIYTLTDEAPLLATYSFLPVIRTFAAPAGIDIEESDISVAARVLAEFPENLTDAQKVPNTLAELGKKTLLPETNIIKLPNISASVGQLIACIRELQGKGYAIPDFPEDPKTDEDKAVRARYAKCIGSCREPCVARGQFGSSRAQGRQGIRPQEPSFHGAVEPGLPLTRLAHAPWRFLSWRKIHDAGQSP